MQLLEVSRMSVDKPLLNIEGPSVALPSIAPSAEFMGGPEGGSANFAGALSALLNKVDRTQHTAASKMAAVDSGASDDLVGAMVASQEASLSFSMLMQVRNKLAVAVDDLLKMQL